MFWKIAPQQTGQSAASLWFIGYGKVAQECQGFACQPVT
jgi:hypothetical protein